MSDLMKRIESLSPEKRDLLLRQLRNKGGTVTEPQFYLQRSKANEFPLAWMQEQLWVLDQLEPGNIAYNIPLAFHLRGPLDIAALQQSLKALVQRHESLRTTFAVVNGQPIQRVAPTLHLQLPLE